MLLSSPSNISNIKVLLLFVAVIALVTKSSITSAEAPNLIYEGSFCGAFPCIKVTIAQQNFMFLVNTGIDYSVAESDVINLFQSQPKYRTVKDFEGRDEQLEFYSPLTMRLGGVKALNSGFPVASKSIGRFKELGLSGILGTREMLGLVWDLDFEHSRVRVYRNKEALDKTLFPIKVWIQGTSRLPLPPSPSTLVTLAGRTFSLELELLEPEDIQINHTFIDKLLSDGVITKPSNTFQGRIFENGSKYGITYDMAKGHSVVSLGGYNYNNMFTVSAGYDPHLGHGFFSRQKRVVIDLNEENLWIIPSESLQNCLSDPQ